MKILNIGAGVGVDEARVRRTLERWTYVVVRLNQDCFAEIMDGPAGFWRVVLENWDRAVLEEVLVYQDRIVEYLNARKDW